MPIRIRQQEPMLTALITASVVRIEILNLPATVQDDPPHTGTEERGCMNMTELQGWLTLLLSASVAIGGLIFFYFKIQTNASKEIYQAEKKEVLNSIAKMAEVMTEFRITQKETEKTVSDLKMTTLEIKIKVATLSELFEKFYRDMTVDTGDGYKIDPRKANKQK
jgi:hypothetical protein